MEEDENISGNMEASKLATFSIYSRQESQPNQDDQTTTQDSRRAQDTITTIEVDTVQDSHETCDDQVIQESQGTHDNNLTKDKESSKQTKGIKIKAIKSLVNIRGQISTLSGEGKQEITSFFRRESKAFREEMKKDLYQYPEEDTPVDIHELFKEWKGEGKASFGYWKKIFQRRPGERIPQVVPTILVGLIPLIVDCLIALDLSTAYNYYHGTMVYECNVIKVYYDSDNTTLWTREECDTQVFDGLCYENYFEEDDGKNWWYSELKDRCTERWNSRSGWGVRALSNSLDKTPVCFEYCQDSTGGILDLGIEYPKNGFECLLKEELNGILTCIFTFTPGLFWSLNVFYHFWLYLSESNKIFYDRKRMWIFCFIPLSIICTVTFPIQFLLISLFSVINEQEQWSKLSMKIGIAEGLYNATFQFSLQLYRFVIKTHRLTLFEGKDILLQNGLNQVKKET